MYAGKTVSVVFPVFNEEQSLAQAIQDFFAVGCVDEIVVIDNNSNDHSAEIARATRAKVAMETRQGYGYALRRGMQEATGDLIILAEPDGTFVAKDILKLLAYSDDFDLVLGTRTTRELIWTEANMGLLLRYGNWAVAKLLELLFNGPSISDCGCTMRLIQRAAMLRLLPCFTVGGSHFLPEMVILGLLGKMHMVEIPVHYRGRLGTSKITGSFTTTIRVGWRMLKLILGYRVRIWLGRAPCQIG